MGGLSHATMLRILTNLLTVLVVSLIVPTPGSSLADSAPPGPDAGIEATQRYKEQVRGCTQLESEATAVARAAADAGTSGSQATTSSSSDPSCNSGSSRNIIDLSLARPGDILLMTSDDMNGWLGAWCHSALFHALYDSRFGTPTVIEAIQSGQNKVVVRSADSFVLADKAVLERANSQCVDRYVVRDYALAQEGKPYNLNYCDKYRQDQFYCSQLVWASFWYTYRVDMDSNHKFNLPFGCDVVVPEDVYWSPNNYIVSSGD